MRILNQSTGKTRTVIQIIKGYPSLA